MKVEIKYSKNRDKEMIHLFNYFQSLGEIPKWNYNGLIVELDPTIDFISDNALIRWTDIDEGFNDKLIVNSLEEFLSNFELINA